MGVNAQEKVRQLVEGEWVNEALKPVSLHERMHTAIDELQKSDIISSWQRMALRARMKNSLLPKLSERPNEFGKEFLKWAYDARVLSAMQYEHALMEWVTQFYPDTQWKTIGGYLAYLPKLPEGRVQGVALRHNEHGDLLVGIYLTDGRVCRAPASFEGFIRTIIETVGRL